MQGTMREWLETTAKRGKATMEDTARVGRRPEKEKLLGKATEVAAAAATAAREAMAAGIGRKRRREKSKRMKGEGSRGVERANETRLVATRAHKTPTQRCSRGRRRGGPLRHWKRCPIWLYRDNPCRSVWCSVSCSDRGHAQYRRALFYVSLRRVEGPYPLTSRIQRLSVGHPGTSTIQPQPFIRLCIHRMLIFHSSI